VPVAWAWLGFGSQGRAEQALGADQDNALMLAPDYDESRHGDYFTALAERVCHGLAACGYRLCPGEIMAMNPGWRLSLPRWQETFAAWIDEPTPKALMHSSIFFDMRCIAGDPGLVEALHGDVLRRTADNSIFLACLYSNVMTHTPPLGFFRTFVLERSGEHEDRLDLKGRGIIPIVDIARLYALAAGVPEVNTIERLRALGGRGDLTLRDARALADAYEFISRLRLEHQGEQLKRGEAPDNYLDPGELSALRRDQLKEAFGLVRRSQKALGLKYGHR
jgi:CBS domain-containing protein